MARNGRSARPDELDAAWQRSLMIHPDGRRDATGWVLWLQHGRTFSDLRQPDGRPDMSKAGCLDALNNAQLRWLAGQNGFAGTLAFDGVFYEWQREIAFQPEGPTPDSATLFFEGEMLVELGQHAPYREDWHALPTGNPEGGSLRLRRREDGRDALMVRHGDYFMFARDRGVGLSADGSLLDQLDGAGSEQARRALVDCEISFGRISSQGWRIDRSTLPYQEGTDLAPGRTGAGSWQSAGIRSDGAPVRQEWEIIGQDGNEADLA